ncbi:MAG: enoyl-CoA hydratase-related protein [Pseudomonadota bacterium]
MADYDDLKYDVTDGVATITINRPERMNALRPQTYEELIDALSEAAWSDAIGVIVLTGAGDRAFCIGGDNADGKSERRGRGVIGVPIETIHTLIRDAPKPVIARVNGYAIGGGNVLATLCDLTIASATAQFGQVGPKVGSVDPGFGTAYLARAIGEKRAREFWYLCRRYTAEQALQMGLANAVVPPDDLDAEVRRWCDELLERSPTALAIAKRSFNADTEHLRGVALAGFEAVKLYYDTAEAKEMSAAFKERRKPHIRPRVKA